MKKNMLMSGALLLLSLPAAALNAGTDIFSVESLTEAGLNLPTEAEFSTSSYTSPTTGTPYLISNFANQDGMLYFSMSMGLRNTESCGYLKEIRVNDLSGTFTIYAANEPVSTSPFMQAGVTTLNLDRETGVVTADAPYRYIGIWTYETSVSDIEIEWSDEAPVVTAAKPYMILNSDLGTPSGTTVTIGSDTAEASLEVVMTKGSETILSETLSNPCTVTLEGEVGDRIVVQARAVADGYLDSDWLKRTYRITNPILAAPEISLSSYSSVVTLGDKVTLTNPNHEGSSMTYILCGGEPVVTTETSVSLTAEGNVGDEWSLTAWCEAEGWDDSEQTEWTGTIASNICPAPTFSPAPGEYALGTSIRISATYPASSVTYRINGGEWQTSTSLWNLSVVLDEDMTIEAYSSAAAPYVDSETVSARFSVERLGADCDIITCPSFGEVGSAQFAEYTTAVTANGSQYQMMGREMSDAMMINGSGYIRTLTSTHQINRVKVDALFMNSLILYVSDQEISGRNSALTYYVIDESLFGQWIEIPETENARYFYLTAGETDLANCISRVVVDYGEKTAVGELEQNAAETLWFDLTGRRIAEPKDGIYIQVRDGVAKKVVR